MARLLSNWSLILILLILALLSSQSHLCAYQKNMGVYFPAEAGLREINRERKTAIKWRENTRIVFLPGPKGGIPGYMHMLVYKEKKVLFEVEGEFWHYFEAKDFPYKSCTSLIIRDMAEGHKPDSFIVLVRLPDGRLMVYVIDQIWSEKSVNLITAQGPSKTKIVHLTFGSYSTCADRFYYSRAAIFDKHSLGWRLDIRRELPTFYRPQIIQVETDIQQLLYTPVNKEDKDERKRKLSQLVFESAYYRYMMGESLENVAKKLIGRFSFSAEERDCVKAMIREVDNQLEITRNVSVAKKYNPGSVIKEEFVKAKSTKRNK